MLEDYTDSDRTDHEIAKAKLRQVLLKTDSDNRLSGRELAEKVPVSESTVRDLIGEIRKDGIPVYSNGRGYYCISSGEELDEAIESINDEIQTREQTKEELCKAYNRP